MKAKWSLETPGSLLATISITMTVGQWNELSEALSGSKDSHYGIKGFIRDAVGNLTRSGSREIHYEPVNADD